MARRQAAGQTGLIDLPEWHQAPGQVTLLELVAEIEAPHELEDEPASDDDKETER